MWGVDCVVHGSVAVVSVSIVSVDDCLCGQHLARILVAEQQGVERAHHLAVLALSEMLAD